MTKNHNIAYKRQKDINVNYKKSQSSIKKTQKCKSR